jgi:hypothetical protein
MPVLMVKVKVKFALQQAKKAMYSYTLSLTPALGGGE